MEQAIEETKQSVFYKFKRFVIECRRVLTVTKKPTSYEYKTIVKVSGLGIIIIGLIGFLLQIIRDLMFRR